MFNLHGSAAIAYLEKIHCKAAYYLVLANNIAAFNMTQPNAHCILQFKRKDDVTYIVETIPRIYEIRNVRYDIREIEPHPCVNEALETYKKLQAVKKRKDILRQLAKECKNYFDDGILHLNQCIVALGYEHIDKSIYLNSPEGDEPTGLLSRGYISMHLRPHPKAVNLLWHEMGLTGFNFFWKRIAYQAVKQLKRLRAAQKIKRWWIDMFWNPNTYIGKKRLQRSYEADEYSVW